MAAYLGACCPHGPRAASAQVPHLVGPQPAAPRETPIHLRALAEQDARAGGHHDGLRREEEREGVERLGAGPWRVAHTDPQHGSTHLTNT